MAVIRPFECVRPELQTVWLHYHMMYITDRKRVK